MVSPGMLLAPLVGCAVGWALPRLCETLSLFVSSASAGLVPRGALLLSAVSAGGAPRGAAAPAREVRVEPGAVVAGVVADLEALPVAVAVVFERAVGGDVGAVGALVVLIRAEVGGGGRSLVAPAGLVALR